MPASAACTSLSVVIRVPLGTPRKRSGTERGVGGLKAPTHHSPAFQFCVPVERFEIASFCSRPRFALCKRVIHKEKGTWKVFLRKWVARKHSVAKYVIAPMFND